MVLSVEFITWLPFTCRFVWSTEAERVGVNKANVLLLKIKLEKETKVRNKPKIFNSRLNHPPHEGLYVIFGLAYIFILP